MKKFFIYFGLGLVVAGITISIYVLIPSQFEVFDNKLRDMLFINRGAIEQTGQVVIVDIDERSLKEIGQFPWKRNDVAKMVNNLGAAGVSAIGFDIMFPEPDKSSPHRVISELGIADIVSKDKQINYDELLASAVAKTPTILGYTFDFDGREIYKHIEAPKISANLIERNKGEFEYLPEADGVISNIPIIQDASSTSGFFNVWPDSDGVIRSVPLAIVYDSKVYPSLALELVRMAYQQEQLDIIYDASGVRAISIAGMEIPTDIYGQIAVNFRGPSSTFDYISAVDIIKGDFNPANIEGKIVLIGTSAAGLLDLRNIPYDTIYPGVEVHANVIDNIIAGDFLHIPAIASGINVVLILFLAIIIVMAIGYSSALALPFIIAVTAFLLLYFINYLLFTEGIILSIFYPLFTLILGALASIITGYFFETKQKNLIRGKFASKVSPQVMEDIIKNAANGEDAFIAKEHEISVTFSDVRNFTNISEAAGDANTLIQFLNQYMDEMTQIITKYEGTVDKFIGDAIMAYWNAPATVKNHTEKAVDATLDQIHAVAPLNVSVKKDERFANICKMAEDMGVEPIEIGIGINIGVATIGEMGSRGRSDYTAIGDPINLGARLEALCKFYNSMCNISGQVKERIPQDKYLFRFLDLVTVKGQSIPVEIWQIIDYADLAKTQWKTPLYLARSVSYDADVEGNTVISSSDNDVSGTVEKQRLLDELEYYNSGIEAYKEARFEDALNIFRDIQDNWPDKTNKNIYNMYIERCEHYIEEPPGDDFNGVFVHKTKG
ncbi:MAG: adenylate/guanylate cyclase domain-containing protein [marine bacterium B5-7]|nr:MAG: adenylate/guanylate cyclase domain-containing protein [marine bacterium B5-7]